MTDVNRREFLGASVLAGTAMAGCATTGHSAATKPPNVLIILTDDHGYGDMHCHGNPHLKTPNIDRLHTEGLRLTQYHHSPVCAPTRASLMTGRYNYRTCAIDTFRGRAMMHPDETTMPEMFSAAGYRTGIFGKWHLGDCFPMRATDRGFQESLVHHGGGLKQPSDPPGSGGYYDPILMHNGALKQYQGYCTDLFASAAIEFVESNQDEPFFCYLATNSPHVPLLVDERYVDPYRAMGLPEPVAKIYGMIANVDENIGRVLDALDRLKLVDNTIVIFMTDNGAQMPADGQRFNAGMRGTKSTVYEGGLRVPCFMRWPERLQAGRDVDRLAAHIDIAPTLLDACGIRAPERVQFDGRSLWPLLSGKSTTWNDRTLFFQWHRGDVPEPYNNCAARTQQYKLVNGVELYDLGVDPAEATDIAATHPEIVKKLRDEYEAWFADVSATRGYIPPRIVLGDARANPVYLTVQDQRGNEGSGFGSGGYWSVEVARAGRCSVTLRFPDDSRSQTESRNVTVQIGGVRVSGVLPPNETVCGISDINLPKGPASVRAWLDAKDTQIGARYVDVAFTV